jgi:HAMP domain-containing protein
MRILLKFNLVLILVCGVGIGLAGYVARDFLNDNARDQVLQQARLMMGAAGSMRVYTTRQIEPLLKPEQLRKNTFLPQTVPAFAATETFNYLRASYPDYIYKEATLNPTNPRDRAVDWEADVIEGFRNHEDQKEFTGERDTPSGRWLFLARPLVAAAPCLQCHSTPKEAPVALLKAYGKDNGFGWKLGETVGAQVVSVPMAVPARIADRAFRNLMIYLGAIGLATLLLIDLLLVFTVIRPVVRLSAAADEISNGNLDVEEIPAKGSDEIAQLARSFNRMHISLAKAMRMIAH